VRFLLKLIKGQIFTHLCLLVKVEIVLLVDRPFINCVRTREVDQSTKEKTVVDVIKQVVVEWEVARHLRSKCVSIHGCYTGSTFLHLHLLQTSGQCDMHWFTWELKALLSSSEKE